MARSIRLKNYEFADTTFKRAVGIMFRKKLTRPLVFPFPYEQIVSIHSFFCVPFDAVFLDKNKRVIELYGNVKPFSFITTKRKAHYLVEMPIESIKKLKIKKGTVIGF
jgi:uncharacterized membrane protein (UPF0127 family)